MQSTIKEISPDNLEEDIFEMKSIIGIIEDFTNYIDGVEMECRNSVVN